MGFWVFMTSMELLLPSSWWGLGNYFLKGGPRQVNSMFGYRTARSMKNEDTWKFAHRHCDGSGGVGGSPWPSFPWR